MQCGLFYDRGSTQADTSGPWTTLRNTRSKQGIPQPLGNLNVNYRMFNAAGANVGMRGGKDEGGRIHTTKPQPFSHARLF